MLLICSWRRMFGVNVIGAFEGRSRTPLWSAVAAGTTSSLPAALRDSPRGSLVARGTPLVEEVDLPVQSVPSVTGVQSVAEDRGP